MRLPSKSKIWLKKNPWKSKPRSPHIFSLDFRNQRTSFWQNAKNNTWTWYIRVLQMMQSRLSLKWQRRSSMFCRLGSNKKLTSILMSYLLGKKFSKRFKLLHCIQKKIQRFLKIILRSYPLSNMNSTRFYSVTKR